MTKAKIVIVSRHKATIEWVRRKYPEAKVIESSVSADDLADFDVIIGNLPMSIASKLRFDQRFFAVEFERFPPRGVELSAEDLEEYGIALKEYVVLDYKGIQELLYPYCAFEHQPTFFLRSRECWAIDKKME